MQSIMSENGDKHVFTEFIKVSVPHIASRTEPLPTFIALLICYINENTTFVWNFLDIFLMIVGFGLSTHFLLFNNEMEWATVQIEVDF